MPLGRRSVVAAVVFVLLCVVAGVGSWYETHRARPQAAAQRTVLLHVTNGGDTGSGTLREALFVAATATGPTNVSIEVPTVTLKTALPPLVNGHGVTLFGQPAGSEIDAAALDQGPVLDVSGPDTAVDGISIANCPGTAILVRARHFHLSQSSIQSCEVGVEVAENASDTLVDRNHFIGNRIGVRFGGSGRNSVVAGNEFTRNKDAALWAVRSTPDARDEVIGIHDNKFVENGVVDGNIKVLMERNDFINAHEAAVHVVGEGAAIRGNRLNGGASMGIIVENAGGALIEDNDLEGFAAYGVMVRGSSNAMVKANRLHNCGYGLAFVLGDARNVSTAADNTIIEPKFNGIDVIGDSPVLRHNQVLRPHAFALHVEDFQPPGGRKIHAQPFLDNNNFGGSPVSTNGIVAATKAAP